MREPTITSGTRQSPARPGFAVRQALEKLRERFGLRAFFELPVYPIVLLVWQPIRLLMTLWSCWVLAEGRWERYNRFSAAAGLNSLFYWSMSEHLARNGRWGIARNCAIGNFRLGRWLHVTVLSYHLYRHAAAVLPITCMFVWLSGNFLWLVDPTVEGLSLTLALALAVLSTSFFAACFVFLNYNVVGWAGFSVFLWGLLSGNLIVAASAILFISLGSLTVTVLAMIVTVFLSVESMSPGPLVACMPAMVKGASHVLPALSGRSSAMKSVLDILKVIGSFNKKAKYRYRIGGVRTVDLHVVYFSVVYLQFFLLYLGLQGTDRLSILYAVLVVFLANKFVARFADDQSIYMLMFCVATTLMILSDFNFLLFISYWLAISPLPLFYRDRPASASIACLPALRPFEVSPIIYRVERFLSVVRCDERVLMAFEDPDGRRERAFDGYRNLLQVPLFVAAVRDFHFFPEEWSMFEANYPGAPEWWGRTPAEVARHAADWSVDYAVVYQVDQPELEPAWLEDGWEPVSELDWKDCADFLGGEAPWDGAAPKWWLLRPPESGACGA